MCDTHSTKDIRKY